VRRDRIQRLWFVRCLVAVSTTGQQTGHGQKKKRLVKIHIETAARLLHILMNLVTPMMKAAIDAQTKRAKLPRIRYSQTVVTTETKEGTLARSL
jgi:hypothetical protein